MKIAGIILLILGGLISIIALYSAISLSSNIHEMEENPDEIKEDFKNLVDAYNKTAEVPRGPMDFDYILARSKVLKDRALYILALGLLVALLGFVLFSEMF